MNLQLFICLLFSIAEYIALGSCGAGGNQCDEWSPCCSDHGFCGRSAQFCGIGCQEDATLKDEAGNSYCYKPPACESKTYTFTDNSRFAKLDNYTGDYRSVDWGVTGIYELQGDDIVIKMPKGSGGGRITSTRYVHFAKITARLKTSKSGGVVTSFITMSEDKDEIDWEWIGSALTQVQTNYYYKGVLDLTNGAKHPVPSDTSSDFHDYTINWTESQLTWLIDGKVVRTLKKEDTLKNGVYNYPVSPSRIEIGLWDGGSGQEGTKEWAGGSINWDLPEVKDLGYFSMRVKSVNVECLGSPTSNDNDYSKIFEGKTNITYLDEGSNTNDPNRFSNSPNGNINGDGQSVNRRVVTFSGSFVLSTLSSSTIGCMALIFFTLSSK